jgi:hypothetical protein
MTRIRLSLLPALIALAGVVGYGAQAAPRKPAAPPASSGQTGGSRSSIAELWIEPEGERDLFHGVGGRRLAPDPAAAYQVIEIKVGGFSEGYTLLDGQEREWSAKFPPEAPIEVTLSRILWGLGYHQPPVYLLREWNATGAKGPNPQLPARVREKSPDLHGLDAGESWAFDDNPFVGTRELKGLLVLQALLENQDIKASNNTVYTLTSPAEGATRWYLVRDLGYSLGRAGFNGPRGDIDAYERAPFVREVVDGQVRFHYRSRYKKLLDGITVADVHWICERLNRLTDRQWRDAFRAGGFEPSVAARFIARIKARAAEGLGLKTSRPQALAAS